MSGEVRRWHCYTSAYESVYASTVNATCADQAAEMAADEHGLGGQWTVVRIDEERGVARVTIKEGRVFEAISVECGPS